MAEWNTGPHRFHCPSLSRAEFLALHPDKQEVFDKFGGVLRDVSLPVEKCQALLEKDARWRQCARRTCRSAASPASPRPAVRGGRRRGGGRGAGGAGPGGGRRARGRRGRRAARAPPPGAPQRHNLSSTGLLPETVKASREWLTEADLFLDTTAPLFVEAPRKAGPSCQGKGGALHWSACCAAIATFFEPAQVRLDFADFETLSEIVRVIYECRKTFDPAKASVNGFVQASAATLAKKFAEDENLNANGSRCCITRRNRNVRCLCFLPLFLPQHQTRRPTSLLFR